MARNYAAEYARRLELGRQRGISRQIARGHHPSEGRLLPDGSRARLISLTELRRGYLKPATLDTMHRVNAGLRGHDAEAWRRAVLAMGWPVVENTYSPGWHTQDDIPIKIISELSHRDRQFFFGY